MWHGRKRYLAETFVKDFHAPGACGLLEFLDLVVREPVVVDKDAVVERAEHVLTIYFEHRGLERCSYGLAGGADKPKSNTPNFKLRDASLEVSDAGR